MYRLIPVLVAALLLGGCCATVRGSSPADTSVDAPADHPGDNPADKPDHKDEQHALAPLHIPPGHLPDPGQCRIWIPGTPPGHQPPQGDCEELASEVPPGAWLISRASKKSKEFDVTVYDDVETGVVLEVRIYSTKDGSFLGLR